MDNMGQSDSNTSENTQPNDNNKLLLFSFTGIPVLDYNLFISTPVLHSIMYMDISYTMNTQAWKALLASHSYDNLRILKLRGLRLTDESLPFDTLRTWLRLWSLDLRDNYLTDQTIDVLLRECFAPKAAPNQELDINSTQWFYEDPPMYHQRDEIDSSDPFSSGETLSRPDTADSFMNYIQRYGNLSSSSPMILPSSDPTQQRTGLTHLYLSSNKFTSRGIQKLLSSSNRLQVLDVGTVRRVPRFEYHVPNTTSYAQPNTAHLLDRRTGVHISHLRIHHSLVTCVPTIVQGNLQEGFIPKHLMKAEKGDFSVQPIPFNPLMNYHLTSLALTDIPTKSTGPTITRLTDFLCACARQEALLLRAAASGPRTRHSPRLLPGLRKLRLEFLNERSGAEDIGTSVSEDQDADEFQAQSQGDFSFFADEKIQSPVTSSRRGSILSSKSSVADVMELKDVIEELKIFRRKRDTPRWTGKLELAVTSGQ